VSLVYLDHNATTPLDPEVRAELDAANDVFGNPSSVHAAGQAARRVVDVARARVARLVGARPEEVVFTGGGTEADNLAVLGAAAAMRAAGRPGVLASAIEHQAVLNPCRSLGTAGVPFATLPVDGEGVLHLGSLEAAITSGAPIGLVSVMLANNDTGAIQPVAEVAARARPRGIVVHTDAVQAAGKVPIDLAALGADLLSLSAHKIGGPKGVGALVVRRGTPIDPIAFGGHQERGLRPGTENVPAIAGFGRACALAADRLAADADRVRALRDRLEAAVVAEVSDTLINSAGAPRLPNTSNFAFAGIEGELLAIHMDLLGIAVSTGAACATGDREPSHVLIAMGRTPDEARSTLRVSLGRATTEDEVDRAAEAIAASVAQMRGAAR
jgi:cysteine desulfurase